MLVCTDTSTTEVASFHLTGQHAGAWVRRFSSKPIEATLALKNGLGPVSHLFQQARFTTDVQRWSEYRDIDHCEGTNV